MLVVAIVRLVVDIVDFLVDDKERPHAHYVLYIVYSLTIVQHHIIFTRQRMVKYM